MSDALASFLKHVWEKRWFMSIGQLSVGFTMCVTPVYFRCLRWPPKETWNKEHYVGSRVVSQLDLVFPVCISDANLPELALKDHLKKEVIRQSSFKASSQGRIAAWVLDTAGFEQCNKSRGFLLPFCCPRCSWVYFDGSNTVCLFGSGTLYANLRMLCLCSLQP